MSNRKTQLGFTLVEIIVATAIFTIVVAAMLTLFSSTLSINRRVQSLRSLSQATRNFTETFSREIRNGRIDYSSFNPHCDSNLYNTLQQSVALINQNGEKLCIYLDDQTQQDLIISKLNGLSQVPEKINPPNFKIVANTFRIIVRPRTEPNPETGTKPGIQPFVTVMAEFIYQPPNGQAVKIPYQTTISTDVYDIPAYSPN